MLIWRALQAAKLHVFRIGCGAEFINGNFTTLSVPFGQTYMDALPPDPENPGELRWPQLDYADRGKTYVDPQTGALLRRASGPSGGWGGGPEYPGSWGAPFLETDPHTRSAWSRPSLPDSLSDR